MITTHATTAAPVYAPAPLPLAPGFALIAAYDDFHDFEGVVRCDADLDGRFELIQLDDGQSYRLSGWRYQIEVLAGEVAQ